MEREILDRAAELGLRVWLHAKDIDADTDGDDGAGVGIGATDPVVTASVFKVPLAVELARRAAAGDLDLAEQVTVSPPAPVASPYGLATFRHPATLSLDALATLMIGISDNVATDVVFARVGKPALAALLAELGLDATVIDQDCAELLATIGEDLGVDLAADRRALLDLSAGQLERLRALRPERTCRTTPADMTRLLGLVWRDAAGPATACADVRRWMGDQVWPHRLRSGFTGDDVRISGKTGTLPSIRNEVGVLEWADGRRYAVAVFTRACDARAQVPARDAFLGFAAARAVDALTTNRRDR